MYIYKYIFIIHVWLAADSQVSNPFCTQHHMTYLAHQAGNVYVVGLPQGAPWK